MSRVEWRKCFRERISILRERSRARNALSNSFQAFMLRFYVLFWYVNSPRSSEFPSDDCRWCKSNSKIRETFFCSRSPSRLFTTAFPSLFAFHAIIEWHSFSAALNWNSNELWRAIRTKIQAVRTIVDPTLLTCNSFSRSFTECDLQKSPSAWGFVDSKQLKIASYMIHIYSRLLLSRACAILSELRRGKCQSLNHFRIWFSSLHTKLVIIRSYGEGEKWRLETWDFSVVVVAGLGVVEKLYGNIGLKLEKQEFYCLLD